MPRIRDIRLIAPVERALSAEFYVVIGCTAMRGTTRPV
ncbi:hypothetical protein RKLH11_1365 [Rhodobacteraceae bacterium KLH11]|nr:hypothetical protein RKLH11_1365 [Rhodobacteraceae bacterium KLH11]